MIRRGREKVGIRERKDEEVEGGSVELGRV